MQILPIFSTKISSSYKYNFQGINKNINAESDNANIRKDITQEDRNLFQLYMLARENRAGITQKEIKELEQYDGYLYVGKVFEYWQNKLGIDKEIAPHLTMYQGNDSTPLAYNFGTNDINVNPNCFNSMNKRLIFIAMRHEFQHYLQHMQLLRHEKFLEKSVDKRVQRLVDVEIQICKDLANMPVSEFMSRGLFKDPSISQMYTVLKYLKERNDEKGFNEFFYNRELQYRKEVMNFQKKVIEKMGLINDIPSNNRITERVQMLFDAFYNSESYYDSKGQVDILKYFEKFEEADAFAAQLQIESEYDGEGCFMCYIKNISENAKKNIGKV